MTTRTGVSPDYPRASNTDPESSHEAARALDRNKLSEQHETVTAAVNLRPGHTSRELSKEAGLDRYMLARRLPELEGVTVERGERRKCSVSGLSALTWYPR